ncbi:MAG: transporter substrate-binding domain-containing protein [Candidatus Hydrogenedentota bacterium]
MIFFLLNLLALPGGQGGYALAQGESGEAPGESSLDFTAAERAWLDSHPMITLAIDDDYPPKNYRNEDGELVGISIDYIRLFEEKLGIEIRLEGSSWTDALEKAMDHHVDGIVNADLLEERKVRLNFTDVYAVYPQALLTRQNEPPLASLSDFAGRTVALKRNTSQLAMIREKFPEINIHETEDTTEGITLLVEGKVDGVFDDLVVLYDCISRRFLSNLKFAVVYSEPPAGHSRIGVRNDAPVLVGLLNKVIDSITDAERRRIEMRWLGIELPRFSPGDAMLKPMLSEAERAWLQTHPVVRVGADPHWGPIEFLDEEGRFQGIAVDYLKEIERILGIHIEFIADKTLPELQEMASHGEVDAFSALAWTEERATRFAFTEPYLTFPVMLFALEDVAYVGDLRELHGERVAIVRSYAIEEWIARDHPEIELVRAKTVPDALDLLQTDEAAAYIGTIVTTNYYLGRRGYSNIHVVGQTPYLYDQRFAIRSDLPLLASSFEKALAAIPETRHNAIYQKWVSVQYEPGFPYSLVWKAGAAVLVLLLLVLFWNYRLARAVNQRTTALSSANEALRRSEERAQGIVSSIADPMLMMDRNRVVTWANAQAEAVFGQELTGKRCEEVFQCERAPCENCSVFRALSTNQVHDNETIVPDAEGNPRHFWCKAGVAAHDEAGKPAAVVEILRDITERKQNEEARHILEDQLRQAQKMEAVGQLAGGVAHDFNNLLQVIRGNIELVNDEIPREAPARAGLEEIDRAADRATTLVRQLLAFGRREKLELQSLDMNDVVSGLLKMIRRLIGEHIEMAFEPAPGEPIIYADRGQIEQIVVNLCVNARDAMPQGGRLLLEVDTRKIDEAFTSRFMETRPGRYVALHVSDTGTGVHPNIQERIFEPFFTTKEVGEGTGLGLATVYAIVKRHEGFLEMESHVGHGTSFHIYLPEHVPGEEAMIEEEETGKALLQGNNETVLIAEDDDQVRYFAERVLQRAGYHVLLAKDGEEATHVLDQHSRNVDLVLLDIVMPKKSGGDVHAEIAARFPDTRVVLMSGYSFDVLEKGHLPSGQLEILRKPFRSETLLRCVREALSR